MNHNHLLIGTYGSSIVQVVDVIELQDRFSFKYLSLSSALGSSRHDWNLLIFNDQVVSHVYLLGIKFTIVRTISAIHVYSRMICKILVSAY